VNIQDFIVCQNPTPLSPSPHVHVWNGIWEPLLEDSGVELKWQLRFWGGGQSK